jgi:hypothetical protein
VLSIVVKVLLVAAIVAAVKAAQAGGWREWLGWDD